MKNWTHAASFILAAVSVFGCKTINQRDYYQKGIASFSSHVPPSSKSCWLTPDLTGPQAGSNAIAEEEFTRYLLSKNLCRIVEKHADDVAGYAWPKDDQCPCASGVQSCASQCMNAAPAAAAAGGGLPFAMPSLGGSSAKEHDNWRSEDKLLERYKKAQLVDKVIVYRIDEMNDKHCLIHFRVSDAKANSGAIEQSAVVEVFPAVVVAPADSQ